MKKFIKYILISIVSLFIIIVVGLVSLVLFVNPNQFKPVIEKSVFEATGRVLKLDGNISWKIFPNLGINVKDVSLSNPDGFTDTKFLSVTNADISVALIPLLSRHIAMKTLVIDGLNIALTKINGKNNWTFSTPQENRPTTLGKESEKPKGLELELNSFSFTNSSFSYDDFDQKKHYKLNKVKLILDTEFNGEVKFNQDKQLVNLEKVNLNYNDMVMAKLNFKVEKFTNPEFAGNIDVSKLMVNKLINNFKLSSAKPMALLNNISFKGKLAGNTNSIKADDFSFNLNNQIKGSSTLNIKNLQNLNIQGKISLEQFNLNQVLQAINQAKLAGKPIFNAVTLNTQFNVNKENILLNNLNFNFTDYVHGTVNLVVNNLITPKYTGNFNLPEFSLNKVMQGIGEPTPKLANKSWLNSLALSSNINGATNSLSLQGLKLRVSNTNLFGNVNISSIKPLTFNENISIDGLNVEDFSDINGFKVPIKQIQINGGSGFNGSNNPISSLNGKQNVSVGNITLRGISLDNLVMQLDKIINKAGNEHNDVVGILINSSDVINSINRMKQHIEQNIKPGNKDYNQITNLGIFTLNTTINHGVVSPSSFKLSGPTALVEGSGSLNLVTKSLNYRASAKLLTNGINPIFKKVEFPVLITGTTTNPSGTLDWDSIQKQLISYAVNQNKRQIQQSVKQGINQLVGEEVKKNLGNQNGDKAVDDVSKSITNAIGNLLGGGK